MAEVTEAQQVTYDLLGDVRAEVGLVRRLLLDLQQQQFGLAERLAGEVRHHGCRCGALPPPAFKLAPRKNRLRGRERAASAGSVAGREGAAVVAPAGPMAANDDDHDNDNNVFDDGARPGPSRAAGRVGSGTEPRDKLFGPREAQFDPSVLDDIPPAFRDLFRDCPESGEPSTPPHRMLPFEASGVPSPSGADEGHH